ncbi:hypothetical protein DUNSADRAFT_6613 [Dunaliella salina]|uniref:Encoded protein n=1 Tax=Dunaliella salina TaxID=3046 RepID=A0ABQ7FTR2_DUNSA|nr:hypothetical protein DUNSADRAFT_6613 [Dunaliella salina]|eukprot:KAF5825830.1 hypothetical protein DUNSADRAFT_6613 [Dunaliella salina]
MFSVPGREWQRGLMRALRLSIPRPPTSDSVLPMLLMVAGLVPPSSDANADPSSAGAKADPSSVGANADPSSAAGQSPLGVAQPVGASPASLAALQPTAVSRAGGAQDGGPLLQGQQQEFMPPRMSKEEVLAVLPPQAAQSVWLAAFLTELKAQWGMGRML